MLLHLKISTRQPLLSAEMKCWILESETFFFQYFYFFFAPTRKPREVFDIYDIVPIFWNFPKLTSSYFRFWRISGWCMHQRKSAIHAGTKVHFYQARWGIRFNKLPKTIFPDKSRPMIDIEYMYCFIFKMPKNDFRWNLGLSSLASHSKIS